MTDSMRDRLQRTASGQRCGVSAEMVGQWLESQGWDVEWEVVERNTGGNSRGHGRLLRSSDRPSAQRTVREVSWTATRGDDVVSHVWGADTLQETSERALQNN